MSLKAGKYKTSKNISKNIGEKLENIGQYGEDSWVMDSAKKIIGGVGQAIGGTYIPVVGGMLGKAAGEAMASAPFYLLGNIGEVGKMMQGESNIVDVLAYAPKRYITSTIDDIVNHPIVEAIKGEKTVPDAIIDTMMNNATLLEPMTKIHDAIFGKPHDRVRIWVNKNGDTSLEWKPGYNRIMWGNIETKPAPIYNGSEGILGTYQGQVYRRGVDDAAWAQLQKQNKVK